jgi:hypothetical protein
VGKYGRARQGTDDNIIPHNRDARILRHTHNISYILLFSGHSGYMNVPECDVIRTMLFLYSLLKLPVLFVVFLNFSGPLLGQYCKIRGNYVHILCSLTFIN